VTDTICIVSLFIVSILLCHALLLSNRIRQSISFWYVIEYLWLATAAVALTFASFDINRLRVSSSLQEGHSNLRSELNSIRMHAANIWEFQGRTRDKDGGRKGIDWFKKVSDELELGPDSPRWEIFASQNYDDLIRLRNNPDSRVSYIPNPIWESYRLDTLLTNPNLIEDARVIVGDLENLRSQKFELYKLESEIKAPDIEKSARATWPWFLCFALAMRITKVTSDLMRHRRSL
jgi:hypothetical protein